MFKPLDVKALLDTEDFNMRNFLKALEKEMIEEALSRTQGNKAHAARVLDIYRTTLLAKMKTFGMKLLDPSG